MNRYAAERHEWFPPPAIGSWWMSARDDPVSGLIAWPGFFARLPHLVAEHLATGRSVGVGIGEVDGLRGYIEDIGTTDAGSFGHLAGVELRRRLGATARDWLHDDDVRNGCLATFGGAEIVLVAEVESERAYIAHLDRLRAALSAALPRSMSFGATVIEARAAPKSSTDDGWRDFCVHVIGRVERALWAQTSARRHHRPSLPIAMISIR